MAPKGVPKNELPYAVRGAFLSATTCWLTMRPLFPTQKSRAFSYKHYGEFAGEYSACLGATKKPNKNEKPMPRKKKPRAKHLVDPLDAPQYVTKEHKAYWVGALMKVRIDAYSGYLLVSSPLARSQAYPNLSRGDHHKQWSQYGSNIRQKPWVSRVVCARDQADMYSLLVSTPLLLPHSPTPPSPIRIRSSL